MSRIQTSTTSRRLLVAALMLLALVTGLNSSVALAATINRNLDSYVLFGMTPVWVVSEVELPALATANVPMLTPVRHANSSVFDGEASAFASSRTSQPFEGSPSTSNQWAAQVLTTHIFVLLKVPHVMLVAFVVVFGHMLLSSSTDPSQSSSSPLQLSVPGRT